jgi:transposase
MVVGLSLETRDDADVAVYVCVTPVDMRKQAATLAPIVVQVLNQDIFQRGPYAFSNARRDRIKIVYWHRNGLCRMRAFSPCVVSMSDQTSEYFVSPPL